MAATLIEEDGSGISNANTYITLAEYVTYLDEQGLTDSTDTTARTGRIIQAKDWLESQAAKYQGTKNTDAQALVWPRYSVYVYGYYIQNDTIPQQLKDAQAQLVYDSATTDIYNINDGRSVIREKVDVLEVEYAAGGTTNAQPIFAKVNALLQPLFNPLSGVNSVIRV